VPLVIAVLELLLTDALIPVDISLRTSMLFICAPLTRRSAVICSCEPGIFNRSKSNIARASGVAGSGCLAVPIPIVGMPGEVLTVLLFTIELPATHQPPTDGKLPFHTGTVTQGFAIVTSLNAGTASKSAKFGVTLTVPAVMFVISSV
jgi:hypothetical protein